MTSRDRHASSPLSDEERERYSRHILLPEVGEPGQRKLKTGSALVVGAGGLGSPAALYLAAAGVGRIGIIDDDVVELANLQRQILHSTASIGVPKVESARARLEALNPGVQVVTRRERLTSKNALEILSEFDVVLDGTDNFPTRYLVNDACVILGKPYVYASVLRFEGCASTFGLPDGPCYRCLFPEPPPPASVPSCSVAGVLGVMPGLLGVIQAAEAIKLLIGTGDTLSGRLLIIDGLRMRFREIAVRRDPDCVACGKRTLCELPDYEQWCAGSGAGAGVPEMDPKELAARIAAGVPLDIVDVREPWEWGVARIEGARLIPLGTFDDLIGTLDPSRDLVLYCHHGARSLAAAERLVQAGFHKVYNLRGGIDRWRREVDPLMRAY